MRSFITQAPVPDSQLYSSADGMAVVREPQVMDTSTGQRIFYPASTPYSITKGIPIASEITGTATQRGTMEFIATQNTNVEPTTEPTQNNIITPVTPIENPVIPVENATELVSTHARAGATRQDTKPIVKKKIDYASYLVGGILIFMFLIMVKKGILK